MGSSNEASAKGYEEAKLMSLPRLFGRFTNLRSMTAMGMTETLAVSSADCAISSAISSELQLFVTKVNVLGARINNAQ